jgi:hypothetical protein
MNTNTQTGATAPVKKRGPMTAAEKRKRSNTQKRNAEERAAQKTAGGNGGATLTIALENATPAIEAILANPLGPWNPQQLEKAWRDVQGMADTSRENLETCRVTLINIDRAYGFIEACRNRHQQAERLTRTMGAGGQI